MKNFDLARLTAIELERLGHVVALPEEFFDRDRKHRTFREALEDPTVLPGPGHFVWRRKAELMRQHFQKIVNSQGVLAINTHTDAVKGHVGSNTLLELGKAFDLRKLIFLAQAPDPSSSNYAELCGMQPIILNGDYTKIPV